MLINEEDCVLLPHVSMSMEKYIDNQQAIRQWLFDNIGDEEYDWECYFTYNYKNIVIITFGKSSDIVAFKIMFGELL